VVANQGNKPAPTRTIFAGSTPTVPISNVSNQPNPGVVSRPNPSTPAVRVAAPLKPPVRNPKIPKNGHEAVCASCGQVTITAFEPDGIRPVYCRDCLSQKKEDKRQELESRRVAKEAEKLRFEEVAEEPVFAPSISLGDLNKINPVDFRGHEMKVSHAEHQEDADVSPTPASSAVTPKLGIEKELPEGEEIIISQNNY
jgi:CxxC-x17-CxxC domain-containing protein